MDETHFLLISTALGGGALGALLYKLILTKKLGSFHLIAQKIIQKAEQQATLALQQAEFDCKQKQLEQQRSFEMRYEKEKRELMQEEERLRQREDKLDSRIALSEKKLDELEKKALLLTSLEKEVQDQKEKLSKERAQLISSLEEVAKLDAEGAKALLLQELSGELFHEKAKKIAAAEKETRKEIEQLTARLIITASNRLASCTISEATASTVSLPSDEMKGRIIGKEGRNIRALEKVTGASFLMDDTPQTVVISCFDPVRRAIAKTCLLDLIADGRIHPTRIEEAKEKAEKQIERQIYQFGQDAALRSGAINLHPELITLLGKLKFRYSLGQNVLEHSLEVSHLMGLMAAELGLDQMLARRIGILHDIGKAVSHEMQGTHALIGRDFALKFGESQAVANGIGCHHNEIEAITLEGSLCATADAISASRPGARIDAIEEYIQRLHKLEELAHSFEGVEKAYVLQAGREIRVMVYPDQVQDEQLLPLARELTKRIETELVYPGKIKISLYREKRVVDYAM